MGAADQTRYNLVAMMLHWLMAVLVVVNIGLAWWFNSLNGPAKIPPIELHRSIGLTVLLLSVLRLAWRFIAPPPPLPAGVSGWHRPAAQAMAVMFYAVMIAMPLSGWAMSSAMMIVKIRPMTFWGLFEWPVIAPIANLAPASMKAAHETFEDIHGLIAKLAYGLIVLHTAAALRHQFLLRDGVMARMVPFLRAPSA